MRILVATQGEAGLNDSVSPVFGRAPTFTFVEVENGKVKGANVQPNKYAGGARGVGIQAAQFAANKDVTAIIAGNIGPNASNVLNQSGIEIVTGFGGMNVEEAVQNYIQGAKPSRPQQVGPSPQQPYIPPVMGQRSPTQSGTPQTPYQGPPPQQMQPLTPPMPSKPSKIDIDFQKRMLELQKRMIEEQIKYLEKKIRESKEKGGANRNIE